MRITFKPKGVCSQLMDIDVEENIIKSVRIEGGCSGNLQAISALLIGMEVKDAVERMKGIRCGRKPTSCPDQLAFALETMENNSH